MCNLSDDEIAQLGLWSVDVNRCHYFFVYEADLVARLAGYRNMGSFWMPRSLARVRDFIATNPGSEALFDAFLSSVDDPEVEKKALELRHRQERTPISVLRTLRVLKETFWQDIGYYKHHYPSMRIFSTELFRRNEEVLNKWIEYVESFSQETNPTVGALGDDATLSLIHSNEMGQIREALSTTNQLLSQVTKQMSEPAVASNPTGQCSLNNRTIPPRCSTKRGLRPLNGHSFLLQSLIYKSAFFLEMEVKDVVHLWRSDVTIEGVHFEGGLNAVRESDATRPVKERMLTKDQRSYVRRIQIVANKVEEFERHMTTNEAVSQVERLRLKGDKKLAIWELAEQLSKSNT